MALNWTQEFLDHARASGHTNAQICASEELQKEYEELARQKFGTVVFDVEGNIVDRNTLQGAPFSTWNGF